MTHTTERETVRDRLVKHAHSLTCLMPHLDPHPLDQEDYDDADDWLPVVTELLAEAWEAALDHVWALNDPVSTIHTFDGERPVVVRFDIEQAKAENPYSRDGE